MTTTFNTMPPSALLRNRLRSPIIAALSLAICIAAAGCSMIKIGYGQASPLAFRWLDRYIDFDDAQSLRVRTALDEAMVWHRRTQLTDYVDLLVRAQAEVGADATPERMCAWGRDLRARVDTAFQYAVPTIAEVALTLSPAQIASIEKRQADTNEEYRSEYLQRDPGKRRKAAVKREIERAETLYGGLDDAQRELVVRFVASSPYDAEASYAERQQRQREGIALTRRLREAGAGRDEAVAQTRAYVQRLNQSPRESYRSYAERLVEHNCNFASALHNATTPAQRRAAANKLKGYENDLRALIADAAG